MVDRLTQYEQERSPASWWPVAGGSIEQRSTLAVMQRQFGDWCAGVTKWVIEHPEVALTGAVTTGVVLGWLIKRR